MPRCAGIKRDGGRCTAIVEGSFCYQHDPEKAAERRRNASRAGKRGGSKELRDLKHRISGVIDGVLDGDQDKGRAAVAIQGFNALRGVLELERKVRELDELEARIEELERSVAEQGGGKQWGA
jgi:hypothetical protein